MWSEKPSFSDNASCSAGLDTLGTTNILSSGRFLQASQYDGLTQPTVQGLPQPEQRPCELRILRLPLCCIYYITNQKSALGGFLIGVIYS